MWSLVPLQDRSALGREGRKVVIDWRGSREYIPQRCHETKVMMLMLYPWEACGKRDYEPVLTPHCAGLASSVRDKGGGAGLPLQTP